MGRKYYLHPSAVFHEGKAFCQYCGRELPLDERGLPTLKTDWPCTVSAPLPFDEEVSVSVWNMQATVLLNKKAIDYDRLPKKQADKLERLAVESVEKTGGAINMSGIYPPTEGLCKYIEWLKRRGYL
ncbi:MAG: hypothetical protein NZ932_04710 [Candidatus Bathyarchaeota archaeon]|nr:hypothetical protein [Candidatus Bathyarchaeota archaeon]